MEAEHKVLFMASQRLEALGDGIFAVAMTILAIELHQPYVKGAKWTDFLHAFNESWLELVCYFVSFIILGIMWFGHRMMFEYIGRTNRYFIFLGVLFYMVVCLVPFSTRLLAENTFRWHAIMMYAVNLSLCNLTLFAQWIYGTSRATMLHQPVPPAVKKEANFLFLISPVVYGIAIIFCFFIPIVSLAIFVATPVLYLLPNKLDKYLP